MALSYYGLMVLQVDYAVSPPFMSQTAKNHATLMRMLAGNDSTCFSLWFNCELAAPVKPSGK